MDGAKAEAEGEEAMSGIPENEIARWYGMGGVGPERPTTGYELRGHWNGNLFLMYDLPIDEVPDDVAATAYLWRILDSWRDPDIFRAFPRDTKVHFSLIAVTGPYPRPSRAIADITLPWTDAS